MTPIEQALDLAKQLTKLVGEIDDNNHSEFSEEAYSNLVDYVLPALRLHNPQPTNPSRAVRQYGVFARVL